MRASRVVAVLALVPVLALSGCELYQQGGEAILGSLGENAALDELVGELRATPGVAEASHGLDLGIVPHAATVTVSFAPDAADAWAAAAAAIETAAAEEPLDGMAVDVRMAGSGAEAAYRAAALPEGAVLRELAAAGELARLLDAPFSLTLQSWSDALYRRDLASTDPAATLALAAHSAEAVELLDRAGDGAAVDTGWMLPGLDGYGMPDPAFLALLAELARLAPLLPSAVDGIDPEAWPSFGLGSSFYGQNPPSVYLSEQTADGPGTGDDWATVAAVARHLLAAGVEPLRLSYSWVEGEGLHMGGFVVGGCAGYVVGDDDRAVAAALSASGVPVPEDALGYCDPAAG